MNQLSPIQYQLPLGTLFAKCSVPAEKSLRNLFFPYFLTSLPPCLLTSLLPETAVPFPQRWGLLRKGHAVFRREDRVGRLTVAKDIDRFTVPKKESAESIFRRRWRRLLEYHIAVVAGSALRHRVVRRHSE
jgi:hypothetical protein